MSLLLLCLLVLVPATSVLGDKGDDHMYFSGNLLQTKREAKPWIQLRLTSPDQPQRNAPFYAESVKGRARVGVAYVCHWIASTVPLVPQEWQVAAGPDGSEPSYRLDCVAKRAFPLATTSAAGGSRQRATPTAQAPRAAPAGSGPVDLRLDRIEKRLQAIEGGLDLAPVVAGQKEIVDRIDSLRRPLEELSTASGEKKSGLDCRRSDSHYGGRREVIVAVGDSALRFLEIRPPAGPVTVGISPEKAQELLREAQQGLKDPIIPHLYLAVPAVQREVAPFFLQDRLVDPALFRQLGGDDHRRVSHRQAREFLTRLNETCAGVATFQLPTEEQLVVAGHMLYNPVLNGLKPCPAVAAAGDDLGLTQLLGHAWHLTRSPCEPFGDGSGASCDHGSFVRKGGAERSVNPLECMPEYRSFAPDDVRQKDTSFRLALVE